MVEPADGSDDAKTPTTDATVPADGGNPDDASTPDPRDLDSDDDGLDNGFEGLLGTDPFDANSNPQAMGELVFVVPFEQEAVPPCGATDNEDCRLTFRATEQKLDVYLLADLSASMSQELSAIKTNVNAVANAITCGPSELPHLDNCIADVWWGVGTVGYSDVGGAPYTHVADLSSDLGPLATFSTSEPPGCCSEPLLLATHSAITGQGSMASCGVPYYGPRSSCADSPAGAQGLGYPCFRPDAQRVLMLATDEAPISGGSSINPCPSSDVVTNAAIDSHIKIVGIAGATTVSLALDLQHLATRSGAIDIDNDEAPIVFEGVGTDAPSAIEAALRTIMQNTGRDLSLRIQDDPLDDVDVTQAFVEHLQTLQLGTTECANGLRAADTDMDGIADAYTRVPGGTPTCWKLVPSQNTSVAATDERQVFSATVQLIDGGATPIDERVVHFLVPPAR